MGILLLENVLHRNFFIFLAIKIVLKNMKIICNELCYISRSCMAVVYASLALRSELFGIAFILLKSR